jgi:hypothetical protein
MNMARWDGTRERSADQKLARACLGQYGSLGGIRTPDRVVNSHLLYQLSYQRTFVGEGRTLSNKN